MATIGATFLDLIDVYKRSGSDDAIKIAAVIELLMETNTMMQDIPMIECNLGARHRTTLRTSLPTGAWGRLYQGVPQSKSGTAQIEDTTGFFEMLSSIDKRLLALCGSDGQRNAVRLSEARAFLEALSQEMQAALLYANEDLDPEKFTGLTPRFNSATGGTGGQLVNGGGTGSDNTSVWFMVFGENKVHGIYPQGTKAGVMREDKGEQRVLDASSNAYYVMEEMFTQHMGLTVRDYRCVSRICNIDVSALQGGSVDIYDLMRKAFWKVNKHRQGGGTMVIYANSDVLEALDADSTPTKTSVVGSGQTGSLVRLKPTEIDGQEVLAYRGIPVKQVDAILNTEAAVSFA